MSEYRFPERFLWGTATAAHQVEGQNENNTWSAWEKLPGKIYLGQQAGLACDWWGGRWREDLDRACQGGQNAHRFSVEWSRVQPTPDRWDDAALDFYRELAQGMVERGIKPMVTLHHFTEPIWFSERGGWDAPEAPRLFEVFVRRVAAALKEITDLWVTLNEPNGYAVFGYVFVNFPPGKSDIGACFRVMANLLRAHALAYRAIHELQPQARVGLAYSYRPFRAARWWMPPDWIAVMFSNHHFNEAFFAPLLNGKFNFMLRHADMPEVVGTQDFLGLNYYSMDDMLFSPNSGHMFMDRRFPKGAQVSGTGFIANLPEGLYRSLKWAQRFRLPIYITENGIEDCADSLRPTYIVEHIYQIWRAIKLGIPILGYFYWSLTDNFEWERGWNQGFGLWGLDQDTQERFWRPSVDVYARICRTNSLPQELLDQYANLKG